MQVFLNVEFFVQVFLKGKSTPGNVPGTRANSGSAKSWLFQNCFVLLCETVSKLVSG